MMTLMDIIITQLSFAFTFLAVVFGGTQTRNGIVSNYKLEVSVLSTITVTSSMSCCMRCLVTEQCTSVNVHCSGNVDEGCTCDLLEDVAFSTQELQTASDINYIGPGKFDYL